MHGQLSGLAVEGRSKDSKAWVCHDVSWVFLRAGIGSWKRMEPPPPSSSIRSLNKMLKSLPYFIAAWWCFDCNASMCSHIGLEMAARCEHDLMPIPDASQFSCSREDSWASRLATSLLEFPDESRIWREKLDEVDGRHRQMDYPDPSIACQWSLCCSESLSWGRRQQLSAMRRWQLLALHSWARLSQVRAQPWREPAKGHSDCITLFCHVDTSECVFLGGLCYWLSQN